MCFIHDNKKLIIIFESILSMRSEMTIPRKKMLATNHDLVLLKEFISLSVISISLGGHWLLLSNLCIKIQKKDK